MPCNTWRRSRFLLNNDLPKNAKSRRVHERNLFVNRISRIKVMPIGTALIFAGLFVILGGLGSTALAERPWPIPPPAPKFPQPVVATNIVPVELPPALGGILWEAQPLPQKRIPSIPPVNSETYETPGYLKITIEAGTLAQTIQLTYVREPREGAPPPHRLQKLVEVFDLTAYDYQGQQLDPEFRRPWILEVSLGDLPNFTADPSRLMFAKLEGDRWLPMVTNYFRQDNVLIVRIISTGRFAILEESPPV